MFYRSLFQVNMFIGQDEEERVSKTASIWMHLPLLFPKVLVDDLCGRAQRQIDVSSSQLVVVETIFLLLFCFRWSF